MLSAVIVRLVRDCAPGRTIQEAPMIEAMSHGVLDPPHARGMTGVRNFASRAATGERAVDLSAPHRVGPRSSSPALFTVLPFPLGTKTLYGAARFAVIRRRIFFYIKGLA
jgi:hypothetical protein